MANCTIS